MWLSGSRDVVLDPNQATRTSCLSPSAPSRRHTVSAKTRAGHHGNPAIFAQTMSPTQTQRPSAPTQRDTDRPGVGLLGGLGAGLQEGVGLSSEPDSGFEAGFWPEQDFSSGFGDKDGLQLDFEVVLERPDDDELDLDLGLDL